MKKLTFRSLLAIAAAGVLFTACKDENDDGNTSKTTYEFSVKAEDNPISAPADGKTYTILVTSTKTAQAGTSAVAYEVVSSPEWAPAELEQTALVITVAKNSSTEAREPGKVILKQDESDKTLEITVNQAGFSNSMSLEATYSTDRCKVLLIEPAITGFDQNPVYKWTVKGPNDAEAAEAGTDKTLSFIQLETGDYTVELTVTDDSGITETKSATVTVATEATAYSPYISEVLEYNPAVFDTRISSSGISPTDTKQAALRTVADKIVGVDFAEQNQFSAQLGTLGGYIVFRFDHTVMNVPGYCDFRIGSGIGSGARPTPGIVYVAFDKNGNGKPDEDEWYELAGSEYGKTTTRTNVKIVYNRPVSFPTAVNETIENYLSWTINDKETGGIDLDMMMFMWQGMPQWPYWLREGDEGATMTFTNLIQLPTTLNVSGGMVMGATFYQYGYACNSNPRNETKSSFDIDWAVDKNGNKVNLPGIDFVKVQTGALQLAGNFGVSGTIINSAIDLHLKEGQTPISSEEAMNGENK
ncbi:MAG: hypothetical protein LUC96_08310 [Alistipes sp.]|uniref:PKD domain-containing protein n=1 Tax=Alistipes sp. TaxID=1872444 RepID=UPI0025C21EBE|nr:hypothetical protein [Alistipes sp.]MCD8274970.1 hypothetical protein [Alistipes sp.]